MKDSIFGQKINELIPNLLAIALAATLFLGFIVVALYSLPRYKVYAATLEGQAILAKSLAAKQAQVSDAQAKFESAEYLDKAALVLQNNLSPEYLTYLYIQMAENVAEHSDNVIYLPAMQAPDIVVSPKAIAPKLGE